MTPEEKIRQLYNCPNKRVTVLAIFHKEENKTERITIGDVVDIINNQQEEIERLNNFKRFEKFIIGRIHTDKERNLTWDFATKEAEQEAFEKELEKLCDIATARVEIIKEIVSKIHSIITEIYNKYVFDGFDDLSSEEIDAVINYSDDVTQGIDNFVKKLMGDDK